MRGRKNIYYENTKSNKAGTVVLISDKTDLKVILQEIRKGTA